MVEARVGRRSNGGVSGGIGTSKDSGSGKCRDAHGEQPWRQGTALLRVKRRIGGSSVSGEARKVVVVVCEEEKRGKMLARRKRAWWIQGGQCASKLAFSPLYPPRD